VTARHSPVHRRGLAGVSSRGVSRGSPVPGVRTRPDPLDGNKLELGLTPWTRPDPLDDPLEKWSSIPWWASISTTPETSVL
jgi:hypothetical protein